jgi:lactoylglutathione lyase
LGLKEVRRKEVEQGRFTLVFLNDGVSDAELELTYNWDQENDYSSGRNFGHLAYRVDNIYEVCSYLEQNNVEILRPPRDGYMAFIKSPDGISVELLQKGNALEPQEPWLSRDNKGQW